MKNNTQSAHPKRNEEHHTDFLTCIINHYQSGKHMQTQYRHPTLFYTNQNFPLAEMKKPPAKGQPETKAPIGSTIEKKMKFMHMQREEINLKEKPQKLKFIDNFLFTLHPSPVRFSSELKKINQHQEKKYQPFLQKPYPMGPKGPCGCQETKEK